MFFPESLCDGSDAVEVVVVLLAGQSLVEGVYELRVETVAETLAIHDDALLDLDVDI